MLKGECIAQGTYQDLSKSGIDFMALLIEEEDDSAIESDDEPNQMGRRMKRTLSRLHSHSALARADSVQSRSSRRTTILMESQLSILTSETEISIFVSL